MKKIGKSIKKFFTTIGSALRSFFRSIKEGDIFVKLSLLVMGAGYFRRKQYIKGFFVTLFQAAVVLFTVLFAVPSLSKFRSLGTVQRGEAELDPITLERIEVDYDHSFKILLYGIISILILVLAISIYCINIVKVRKLQIMAENGKHINNFREDVRDLFNSKFHLTLLFFPAMGVIIFTVVPLIVMICVAFTNYDINHTPPTNLFDWVGFDNIVKLFSNSITMSFGYAFRVVLTWTLLWAVIATFTCFFGGVLLAMFINNSKTKLKPMWRTLFVIAIAVPQFVTLLLVRNFFADAGIVNTFCSNIGLTDLLRDWGWIKTNFIPFLSDPVWAKCTIIIINLWVGIPYLMIIATGILMNIPVDMQESAKIDGATKFQTFRKITLPYLLSVTGPFLVTQFVANINNFNVIYLLTQNVYVTKDQMLANAQAKEIDLLVTWLYRLTQDKYNYKMGCAIGLMVFAICALFTLVIFRRLTSGDREERFQ